MKSLSNKLIDYEKIVRNALIYFCCLVFLMAMLIEANPDFIRENIFIYVGSFVFCGLLAKMVKDRLIIAINKFYEEEWGKIESKDDAVSWQIARAAIVFILYYFVQLGICMLFAPDFINYRFHGFKIEITLFLFNCLIVYLLYRKFVFKEITV